ncbi:hypothetical protein MMC11_001275 [Xylographa trunciseda]|nr:hypothetical protein [Xylographa trunciseda]
MTRQTSFAPANTSQASIASYTPSPTIDTPPSEAPAQLAYPPPRRPSPLDLGIRGAKPPGPAVGGTQASEELDKQGPGSDFDSEAEEDDSMAPERPPFHRPTDGRSQVPLLKEERGRPYDSPNGSARPAFAARQSTFRSRSPDFEAQTATRRKYTYAAFFLALSLVSFVIQTETAVYIQHELCWNKAYCMLYFTHGSWSLLWPVTLLILRIQKRKMPWATFWRRHTYILRTTAQMVQSQDLYLSSKDAHVSPILYMLKTTAFVTTFLTVAGGSWYVAVNLTSPSDLTAIYNCSAFFAYAFSIPLLKDKFRFDKAIAVAVAIAGVLIVAYGDTAPAKKGESSGRSKCGGAQNGEIKSRAWGNIIIGIGSVLYGLYEVLYKKYACPPEGTSPGRGMIFAMTFGSLIGCFTLFVLWIPLPILHVTGWETFEMPHGEAAWMLLISVLANATFSGSFLVLISLTSPVLSSVAALLTIFLVAIVDWALPGGTALSAAAIGGGLLIIAAFLLLSWSTYREMNEERRRRLEDESIVSDSDAES